MAYEHSFSMVPETIPENLVSIPHVDNIELVTRHETERLFVDFYSDYELLKNGTIQLNKKQLDLGTSLEGNVLKVESKKTPHGVKTGLVMELFEATEDSPRNLAVQFTQFSAERGFVLRAESYQLLVPESGLATCTSRKQIVRNYQGRSVMRRPKTTGWHQLNVYELDMMIKLHAFIRDPENHTAENETKLSNYISGLFSKRHRQDEI